MPPPLFSPPCDSGAGAEPVQRELGVPPFLLRDFRGTWGSLLSAPRILRELGGSLLVPPGVLGKLGGVPSCPFKDFGGPSFPPRGILREQKAPPGGYFRSRSAPSASHLRNQSGISVTARLLPPHSCARVFPSPLGSFRHSHGKPFSRQRCLISRLQINAN